MSGDALLDIDPRSGLKGGNMRGQHSVAPSPFFSSMRGISGTRHKLKELWRILHDPSLLSILIVVVGFLGLFVVFPLVKVLQNSIFYKGTFIPQYFIEFFSGRPYVIRPFFNSLIVASLVAVISTILGFIFAYATVRANIPGRRFFRGIGLLSTISPPFIMALAAIMLFGHNGIITSFIRKNFGISWNIYGLPGLILTETLAFFPMTFLTLEGVLEGIDPSLEEAAMDLGASGLRTFFRVTLPLASPGIAAALLLAFIRSLEDFANPIVIQGRFPVLTTQAYLAITGMYNIPLGTTLSVILLIPTLLAFLLQRYWLSRKSFITITGKASAARFVPISPKVKWGLAGLVLFFSLLILSFYGLVFLGSFTKLWGIDNTFTVNNYRYVFSTGVRYLSNSLKLAAIATSIGGFLGIVIAYVVTKKGIIGRGLIDFLSMLNFAVPGIVIGIGYILAFNTYPIILTGTASIVILVLISQRMPVVVRDSVAILQQLDPAIDEAAADLGADFLQNFGRVILPLAAPALIAGMVYMFAACMTSVSAVAMVASSKWYPVTLAMLSQIDLGALSVAAAYGTTIIAVVLGVILIFDTTMRKILAWREKA